MKKQGLKSQLVWHQNLSASAIYLMWQLPLLSRMGDDVLLEKRILLTALASQDTQVPSELPLKTK